MPARPAMTHGGRDDHVRDAAARRSQECRAAGEYATGSPHAAGIVGIFSSSRSPSRGNIMTTITAIAPDAILPDTFRIPEQQAEQADWSVGPVTGHRVRVLLSMALDLPAVARGRPARPDRTAGHAPLPSPGSRARLMGATASLLADRVTGD